MAEIPAQTLDEGLVRNEVLLIAVPDEDGSPFGAATARELQRESSLSDAWLARDEQQLVLTALRALPHVLHLGELGFAPDEVSRSSCKPRQRQRDTQSCALELIVRHLSNV